MVLFLDGAKVRDCSHLTYWQTGYSPKTPSGKRVGTDRLQTTNTAPFAPIWQQVDCKKQDGVYAKTLVNQPILHFNESEHANTTTRSKGE